MAGPPTQSTVDRGPDGDRIGIQAGGESPPLPWTAHLWPDLVLFFSFYLLLVLILGLWSRSLARRVAADNFHRSVRIFNHVMFAARLMVPVWFTVGVWGLGWGALVAVLGPWWMYRSVFGMMLGTLPAFATWMGLWWSQYPAERALREQNLLVELDNDLPLYRPPSFRSYFLSNFRMQVLFTLLPIAMIVLVRDLLIWGSLTVIGSKSPLNADSVPTFVEAGSSITAAALVFLFAPVLLRRVLNTTPMPDSPLKQRLDALCQRAGVRYRHILVWNTNNHVGNAAVMGVMPWVRYVLLSDVLLAQMHEDEIEAVFAHELGHVVHRHMTWYALFFVVLMLMGAAILVWCKPFLGVRAESISVPLSVMAFLMLFMLFGPLSRRCERQADVFAARTMEMLKSEEPLFSEASFPARHAAVAGAGPVAPQGPHQVPVGRHGAWLFASALSRVAAINNIPITPRIKSAPGFRNHVAHYVEGMVELANNWLHGSIASRMQYLQDLSVDPRHTSHFDRTMFWLYCGILFALFISAASLWAGPVGP